MIFVIVFASGTLPPVLTYAQMQRSMRSCYNAMLSMLM